MWNLSICLLSCVYLTPESLLPGCSGMLLSLYEVQWKWVAVCVSRVSHLQGESEEEAWWALWGDLQLRAAPVHPDVLGEGGGQEPPRGFPVCPQQIPHKPGQRGGWCVRGPRGANASPPTSGWTGQAERPLLPNGCERSAGLAWLSEDSPAGCGTLPCFHPSWWDTDSCKVLYPPSCSYCVVIFQAC